MREWFAEIFGRMADAFGDGVGDARDKLVFEGFFNLHTAERNRASDLGWSQDHPAASERAEGNVLDQLYDQLSLADRAEHFQEPAEQDRGIER